MNSDHKKRILIVDDESMNIDLLRIFLESDYTIAGALNAQQALELAQIDPQPDLILMDVTMPGMNGYEACRLLKDSKFTADIPVIFLTALEHQQDEATGFEVGAVDFISKPIVPEIVGARIRIHLGLEEVRNELRKCQSQLEASEKQIDVLTDKLTELTAEIHASPSTKG